MMTQVQVLCSDHAKGHLRSSKVTIFFLITFDWEETYMTWHTWHTWEWAHCVCHTKAHRMVWNMTRLGAKLGHHVTLTWGHILKGLSHLVRSCFSYRSDTFMAHELYSDFPIQNSFMSTVVLVNEVSEALQRHKCYSANVPLDFLHNYRLGDQIFFQRMHCWRFG